MTDRSMSRWVRCKTLNLKRFELCVKGESSRPLMIDHLLGVIVGDAFSGELKKGSLWKGMGARLALCVQSIRFSKKVSWHISLVMRIFCR